jgi:hypothetical protein
MRLHRCDGYWDFGEREAQVALLVMDAPADWRSVGNYTI